MGGSRMNGLAHPPCSRHVIGGSQTRVPAASGHASDPLKCGHLRTPLTAPLAHRSRNLFDTRDHRLVVGCHFRIHFASCLSRLKMASGVQLSSLHFRRRETHPTQGVGSSRRPFISASLAAGITVRQACPTFIIKFVSRN